MPWNFYDQLTHHLFHSRMKNVKKLYKYLVWFMIVFWAWERLWNSKEEQKKSQSRENVARHQLLFLINPQSTSQWNEINWLSLFTRPYHCPQKEQLLLLKNKLKCRSSHYWNWKDMINLCSFSMLFYFFRDQY